MTIEIVDAVAHVGVVVLLIWFLAAWYRADTAYKRKMRDPIDGEDW